MHTVGGEGFISAWKMREERGHFISYTCLNVDIAVVKLDGPWVLFNCSEIKGIEVLVGQVAVKCSSSFQVWQMCCWQTQVICFHCKLGACRSGFCPSICKKKKISFTILHYTYFCMRGHFYPPGLQRHTHTGSGGCFGSLLGANTEWLQIPGIAAVIWDLIKGN